MLDGNVFAVFTKEDDIIGLYAAAEKIPMNYNLIGYTKGYKSFNVCKTWKMHKRWLDNGIKTFKIMEGRR